MKINPEALLHLAEKVVDDLLEMHTDTGIDLDAWPAAMTLVSNLRCGDRGRLMNGALLCAREIGHDGFHSTMKEEEYLKAGIDNRSVAR